MTDPSKRDVDKVVDDMLDATGAAADIVARGRSAWERDRLLRLAGEAVINRLGDGASKIPGEVQAAMPDVPWSRIVSNRVLVAHIYHRIDYGILWETLARDVPSLAAELGRWRTHEHEVRLNREQGREQEGPGLGF